MLWSTLALGTYQHRFVSWVIHIIFSFVRFISFDILGGLHAFRKPFSIYYVFIQSSDGKLYINKYNKEKYLLFQVCVNILVSVLGFTHLFSYIWQYCVSFWYELRSCDQLLLLISLSTFTQCLTNMCVSSQSPNKYRLCNSIGIHF